MRLDRLRSHHRTRTHHPFSQLTDAASVSQKTDPTPRCVSTRFWDLLPLPSVITFFPCPRWRGPSAAIRGQGKRGDGLSTPLPDRRPRNRMRGAGSAVPHTLPAARASGKMAASVPPSVVHMQGDISFLRRHPDSNSGLPERPSGPDDRQTTRDSKIDISNPYATISRAGWLPQLFRGASMADQDGPLSEGVATSPRRAMSYRCRSYGGAARAS
jgi:hypothetical protein